MKPKKLLFGAKFFVDGRKQIPHGLKPRKLVGGELDAIFVFEIKAHFDDIKAVEPQVLQRFAVVHVIDMDAFRKHFSDLIHFGDAHVQ